MEHPPPQTSIINTESTRFNAGMQSGQNIPMHIHDYDLSIFARQGAPALPPPELQGAVPTPGAEIWYASYGFGAPVVMLHGGLGHSGNWGYQLPTLISHGYQVIVIDSRGHGRSTRDERAYSYERMAADVLAVLDHLQVTAASLIGWSDGACTALILATMAPARVQRVFFFACNMDPSGVREIEPSPTLDRCFSRHAQDYAELSATPSQFTEFVAAVSLMMRTQPNYTADNLAQIAVPVAIVQSEFDEFIKPDHAEYLAKSIPGAHLLYLKGVSHFAPLQDPDMFNQALLNFLRENSEHPAQQSVSPETSRNNLPAPPRQK